MRLKKFDKILILVFLAVIVLAYVFYYRSSMEASRESTEKARNSFYASGISGTIKRIEQVYGHECHHQLWIDHYPTHYVVVDFCKQPVLRAAKIGDVLRKQKNSTE